MAEVYTNTPNGKLIQGSDVQQLINGVTGARVAVHTFKNDTSDYAVTAWNTAGNHFRARKSDNTTDVVQITDSGLVVNGSLTAGGFQTSVFTPEQYGAVRNGTSGGGGTDDRAAIQAAIDAARTAGGGTILFSRGIYRISGTLDCTDLFSVNFFGLGAGPSYTGSLIAAGTGWTADHMMDFTNSRYIRMSGINLLGNNATSIETCLFLAPMGAPNETQMVWLDHCTFTGPCSLAAVYAWGTFFLRITNCGIFINGSGSNNYALALSAQNWGAATSTFNTVLGSGATDNTSFDINARNIVVTGSLVSNQGTGGNNWGVLLSGVSDVHLLSNEITAGTDDASIRILDGASKVTSGIEINGNWFGGVPCLLLDSANTVNGIDFFRNRVDPVGSATGALPAESKTIITGSQVGSIFNRLRARDTLYISDPARAFIRVVGNAGVAQITNSDIDPGGYGTNGTVKSGFGVEVSGIVDEYTWLRGTTGTVSTAAGGDRARRG